jgi:Fe-S cluster assembly ATP-binding protein
MLEIKNLHVSVEGKEILKGVNMEVCPGEIQAIMGPNGSGKSTLAYTLMGHPNYKIEIPRQLESFHQKGGQAHRSRLTRDDSAGLERLPAESSGIRIDLDGTSLLEKTPDERARMGLFMAFQYPVSVEGVSVFKFMKAAYETIRCEACAKGKGLDACSHMSVTDFRKILQAEAERLQIHDDFLRRSLHEGFSGGEKKRLEVLQLSILKPKYAVLDETDSGLDIDALKVVADGINAIRTANKKLGIILITHYQRILRFIKPKIVHVMVEGRIVKSGGEELAKKLEKDGYKKFLMSH